MFKEGRRMKILFMTLFLFGLVVFPLFKGSHAMREETTIASATAVWTDMEIDVPVHPDSGHNDVAYDSESDRVIYCVKGTMETFAYDYNTNTYENLSTPDFERDGSRMAYDSESDIIILFGGVYKELVNGPYIFTNETWAYDYNTNTWTSMTTNMTGPSPSPQGWSKMVYDSESDRIVLVGGVDYSVEPWLDYDDTWAYDYNTNTWEKMNPSRHPESGELAYDVESDRIIAFGGGGQEGEYDETWAYDYNTDTWEKMSPMIKPSLRYSFGITYDIASDRTILFGGAHRGGSPATLPGHPYSDTWTYDYNTDTWIELDLSIHPAARQSLLTEYDQESDKIVIFGGIARNFDVTTDSFTDTWAFDYQPNYASAPQNLQITASVNAANLTWQAPSDDGGSSITNYIIYRGTTSGDLSLLTQLGNVLEYSDTDITTEVTYYYAVKAVNEVGESSASEEVSTTVPAPTTITTPESTNSFTTLIALLAFVGYLVYNRKKKNR